MLGTAIQLLSSISAVHRCRRRKALAGLLLQSAPSAEERASFVLDALRRTGDKDIGVLRDRILQVEIPKCDPKGLLGPLGLGILEEIKSSQCPQLRMAFCRCVRRLGAASKRSVTKFGVVVSEKEWRDCKRQVAGVAKAEKTKSGGRPNKVDDPKLIAIVREALRSMSKVSCRLRTSKSDRKDAHGKRVKLQIRTLNGSKRHIFARKLLKHSSSMKMGTMYRIARRYCYEYVRPKKITDFCDICYHFDTKFAQHVKDVVRRCLTALSAFMASYFNDVGTTLLDHGDVSSDDFFTSLNQLVRHVATHADQHQGRRAEEVPYRSRLDLHNAEAAALKELREVEDELTYFRWHFQTMARQAAVTISRFHFPEANSVHLRYDYKELVRLPVGPKEPGSWFYSDFQTEITVLGGVMVYLNEQGQREVHYHTLVTNVIEHTPTTTIIFLRKIMEFCPKTCNALDLWEDAGNHFRAYEVLYYQVGDVFDEHCNINNVGVNLDPEHHGKGPCDAHFGVLDHWKSMYATETEIPDHLALVEAYRAGAAAAHAFDPPPTGPRYHIHLVDMASRPQRLGKVDALKMEGLGITSTYCLRARRISNSSAHRRPGCLNDIEVGDYVFSDEVQPVRKWLVMYTVEDKGSDDWKVYNAPKSAKNMNYKAVIPKLKSRYEKQNCCAKPAMPVMRRRRRVDAETAYDNTLQRKRAKSKRVTVSWGRAAARVVQQRS